MASTRNPPKQYKNYSDLNNDKDRIIFAVKQLINENKLRKIQKYSSKNTKLADETIEKANEQFKILPFANLIELYSLAIGYAESDSPELARAYANRSAVLCNAKYYEDSLLDIERALNYIDCAEHTKDKLHARRAKCLSALAKKARSVGNNPIDSIEKSNINIFLPKIHEPNAKIIEASSAIDIKYSNKYGVHIIATRNIKAGEGLIVHKSYVSFYITIGPTSKYCSHCLKLLRSSVPCPTCTMALYCNEKCRDDAWNEYHDFVCQVITAMSNLTNELSSDKLMTLRVFIKAYKEAGSFDKLKNMVDKINSNDDPITKFYTNDVFDHTKYTSVHSLEKHFRNVHGEYSIEEALIASELVYYLGSVTKIFGETFNSVEDILKNEWAIFSGCLLMRQFSIVTFNACVNTSRRVEQHGTIAVKVTNGDTKVNLVPLWRLFKHSCNPTATELLSGNVCALVAIQPIKKNDQIFVSHFERYYKTEPTEMRRNFIQSKYNYRCMCIACKNNWGPSSQFVSYDYWLNPSPQPMPPLIECDSMAKKWAEADDNKKIEILSHVANLMDTHSKAGMSSSNKTMLDLKHMYRTMIGQVSR